LTVCKRVWMYISPIVRQQRQVAYRAIMNQEVGEYHLVYNVI
jgi:hypothetical protein